MAKSIKELTGGDILAVGYQEGKHIAMALALAGQLTDHSREEILALLKKVHDYPENYLDDEISGPLARALEDARTKSTLGILLNENAKAPAVFGGEYIEAGAHDQMRIAMKLPVVVEGALMPDAHQGYGLPIGGVLAVRNAVIPYGVGVDIGCRMALSITDIPVKHFLENPAKFKRELIAHTKFGAGANFNKREQVDHEVLERQEFNMNAFVRQLKDKACEQLGTSGGGNHFVEWGILSFPEDDVELSIEKGRYVALLSHSGSRGLGAMIANHYTRVAKQLCQLPKEAVNLAYLDLNAEAGQEYWHAMTLAGAYASACHQVIYDKLVKSVGAELLTRVENHHNFAWKEMVNNQELVVHRKGATPAGKGVMGIIPGSMTASGFLVRGKGEKTSLSSASHGAGRVMSRTRAIQQFTRKQMDEVLKECGVTLIGAGIDEAPMAYKDIKTVMEAQHDLVDVVARFTPKIVRMAADGSRED